MSPYPMFACIDWANLPADDEGRAGWYGRWAGAVRPRLQWETEQPADESIAHDG